MLKKALSVAITAVFILSLAMMPVSAANVFSDVTSKNYPWAVNEIEEMAGLGIIQGYSATRFGPADDITKIQALLLCSRILGYSNSENSDFVRLASQVYGDTLDGYDITYKAEVAYLLYKGVLKANELSVYIGNDNADQPLKRYEAATLMTKVMEADAEAQSLQQVKTFADSADIPAAAKPYVNYVYSIGLMLGMTDTEFVPMFNVNRAQMAVMLYRMMEILDEEIIIGKIESVNTSTNLIRFTSGGEEMDAHVYGDVSVKVDGYVSLLTAVKAQSKIAVIKRGGEVYSIEVSTISTDSVFAGVISSVSIAGKLRAIKMTEVGDTKIHDFNVAEDASVVYEGAPSALAELKAGYYAELEFQDNEVVYINATAKERTVVGTISNIIFTPEIMAEITLTDGTTETYTFIDGATATRNGTASDVRSLLIGDRVTLTVRYNMIAKAVATSTKSTATGTIEEITIATIPTITVKESSGSSVKYSISRDAEYVIDGIEGTVYDLKLGASVTLSVQGETAVKVTSTAPTSTSVLTGTISTLNTSYGFLVLDNASADGTVTQTQVFLKKTGLKVIDSATGKELKSTNLAAGMSVSITGVMNTGAFEATTVIVLP